MKVFWQRSESIVASIILFTMVAVGVFNPVFWSFDNIFNLLRGNIVVGIMALGVLMIMISGGIDVSFPAIAAGSAYISVKIALFFEYQGLFFIIILPIILGGMFGALNALFVGKFKFIPLIATLGTAGIVRGYLLSFVGTNMINITNMPEALIRASKIELISGINQDGSHFGLSVIFLFYIMLAVIVHLILKYSIFGRHIYAIGGDSASAQRVGINVGKTIAMVYIIAGAIYGFSGIINNSLIWLSNPRDFFGIELQIIGAVVLGGASIFGGKGTVLGTMLGVFLIVLVQNSLLIVGIPTTWQQLVIGLIIIAATSITAFKRQSKNYL